jgi:hypothetical protein
MLTLHSNDKLSNMNAEYVHTAVCQYKVTTIFRHGILMVVIKTKYPLSVIKHTYLLITYNKYTIPYTRVNTYYIYICHYILLNTNYTEKFLNK